MTKLHASRSLCIIAKKLSAEPLPWPLRAHSFSPTARAFRNGCRFSCSPLFRRFSARRSLDWHQTKVRRLRTNVPVVIRPIESSQFSDFSHISRIVVSNMGSDCRCVLLLFVSWSLCESALFTFSPPSGATNFSWANVKNWNGSALPQDGDDVVVQLQCVEPGDCSIDVPTPSLNSLMMCRRRLHVLPTLSLPMV
jgi:hypothetical protein